MSFDRGHFLPVRLAVPSGTAFFYQMVEMAAQTYAVFPVDRLRLLD